MLYTLLQFDFVVEVIKFSAVPLAMAAQLNIFSTCTRTYVQCSFSTARVVTDMELSLMNTDQTWYCTEYFRTLCTTSPSICSSYRMCIREYCDTLQLRMNFTNNLVTLFPITFLWARSLGTFPSGTMRSDLILRSGLCTQILMQCVASVGMDLPIKTTVVVFHTLRQRCVRIVMPTYYNYPNLHWVGSVGTWDKNKDVIATDGVYQLFRMW